MGAGAVTDGAEGGRAPAAIWDGMNGAALGFNRVCETPLAASLGRETRARMEGAAGLLAGAEVLGKDPALSRL